MSSPADLWRQKRGEFSELQVEINRLKEDIGYAPRISFEGGTKDMIAYRRQVLEAGDKGFQNLE